ncbi:hypothetical protein BDZ97DRAFT_1823057 [Flammula alnicola]|nr:hypothetical protein BDZ97DRAFT_1823057 [Flammula alnicola]
MDLESHPLQGAAQGEWRAAHPPEAWICPGRRSRRPWCVQTLVIFSVVYCVWDGVDRLCRTKESARCVTSPFYLPSTAPQPALQIFGFSDSSATHPRTLLLSYRLISSPNTAPTSRHRVLDYLIPPFPPRTQYTVPDIQRTHQHTTNTCCSLGPS